MSEESSQETGATTAAVAGLEAQIRDQEDVLFGISLYFHCLMLLPAGQTTEVREQGKALQTVLRKGQDQINDATSLLRRAREDASAATQIERIKLDACPPEMDDVTERARALVAVYSELFSDRSRNDALSDDELFSLIEAASERVRPSPPADR